MSTWESRVFTKTRQPTSVLCKRRGSFECCCLRRCQWWSGKVVLKSVIKDVFLFPPWIVHFALFKYAYNGGKVGNLKVEITTSFWWFHPALITAYCEWILERSYNLNFMTTNVTIEYQKNWCHSVGSILYPSAMALIR